MLKDNANREKHRVSFELARCVFDDPNHVSVQGRHENGEERWQTLGWIDAYLVVRVAHTYEDEDGGEIVRISARKATKAER